MKFTGYAIKRAMITVVGLVLTVSTTAFAQEIRSQVSVQGTGLFTKDSNNDGIQNHSTESGGVLIGYRYSISRSLAAEGTMAGPATHKTFSVGPHTCKRTCMRSRAQPSSNSRWLAD